MRKCFVIFYVLFFYGCSSRRDIDQKETSIKFDNVETTLPDSLFYEKGAKGFKASLALEILNKGGRPLVKISDDLKKGLEKCLGEDKKLLDAYYYSNYSNYDSGDFTPIVLLISTMESNAFVFLTVDKDLQIVSCKELTEDSCSLVDQDDEKEVVWCDTKEAYLSDGNLKLIKKHSERTDFGSHSITKKDSVTIIYNLDQKGSLLLTKKDSTRVGG